MTGGVTFTLGGLRQATGRPVELDRLLPSHSLSGSKFDLRQPSTTDLR